MLCQLITWSRGNYMPNINLNLQNGLAALDIFVDSEMFCDIPNAKKLSLDSRHVDENSVFVGIKSANYSADHFLSDAQKHGSKFALIETNDKSQHGQLSRVTSVMTLKVYQLSSRLYDLAMAFYFSDKANIPNITAITGTNGKTSIAAIVPQLASFVNSKSMSIGTLGVNLYTCGQSQKIEDTINTTPDLLTIMHQLKQACANECDIVCLEASSHGIEQSRLGKLPLRCAVFTNLTQDHLDYHRDMHRYAMAKRKLLTQPKINNLVLNADDQESLNWAKHTSTNTNIRWYSLFPLKDGQQGYWATDIKYETDGLSFSLNCNCDKANNELTSFRVRAFLLGQFNVSNVLASVATLHLQGFDLEQLIEKISYLKSVVGRMEVYPSDKGTLLVDYAHTPDALEQALKACRVHTKGNLTCVFGCGGNRDRTKRAAMGEVADIYCDSIVLTNDNPRNEEPISIVNDIRQGITRLSSAHKVAVELDREKAILLALENSTAEDLVLIAGKGHETYVEINNEKLFYDERALVSKLSQRYLMNKVNKTTQKPASGNSNKRECS